MASAFQGVVERVVRELDHEGELIPVSSLRSSTGFRPYCLLVKKQRIWRHRYTCVHLSIRDILEPSTPEPDVECDGPFLFEDTVDGQLGASVELGAAGQATVEGSAAVSGSSSTSMSVYALRVSPNTWMAMVQERSLRQPEHTVLQQLRSRGDDVFVVTEVLQTQKEVEVNQAHRQEGSGRFVLSGAVSLQGQGQGHQSQRKTVTIPSGSILAFRVAQLQITDSKWDILLIPKKNQKTFVAPEGHKQPSSFSSVVKSLGERLKFLSDGLPEECLVFTEDFQGLQADVGSQAGVLENFSKVVCEWLLRGLSQVLQDQQALRALEEALEKSQFSSLTEPLPSPVDSILECLVLPSGELVQELADPIFYLLDALAELSETQHVLLAKVLETGAMLELVKLVQSLLEQSTPWKEHRDVSLPSELLGSSWDSQAPAWVLLEECGLKLQVGAPQVCWVPEALRCTCALYACLVLLLRLQQLC